MNQTRNLIVATSLALASLGPAVARATTISTSSTGPGAPTALVASAAASGDLVARQRAPLSTGLLALGSATQTGRAIAEGSGQDDAKLAQREQAAPELRSFHGGRVYLYLGGGATLILVLLLILILL